MDPNSQYVIIEQDSSMSSSLPTQLLPLNQTSPSTKVMKKNLPTPISSWVRHKKRLLVDRCCVLPKGLMELQLSDTSDILRSWDMTPPTKKLMHWKKFSGVEKLFSMPGTPQSSDFILKVNLGVGGQQ